MTMSAAVRLRPVPPARSEMRKTLNLQIRDEVEIQMQDKSIVIKKYEPEKDNRCVFCASQENLQQFKGSWICSDCLQELVSK
mgnify:CR=1 FL=1